MRSKYLWLLISSTILFLAGCHSTATRITVLQPAELFVPEHIDVIAIVDRSKPQSGWAQGLEAVLTGEQIFQDRNGRRRAIEGLSNVLSRTPRFKAINTGMELTGSKAGSQFPPPLTWHEIEDICKQFQADAVLAIELFDSDSYTSTTEHSEKHKDKDGKETIRKYFNARLELNIKMGWRLYDPRQKIIFDEFITRDETSDQARGDNRDQAIRNLNSSGRIVGDLSYKVGELYGTRIAPIWINVDRNFYTKTKGNASDMMEKAAKYAKAGEWDAAAEIWRTVISTSGDQKSRGRAAHNMAVANERAGKLESALDWAKKAYLEFEHKPSKNYIDLLRMRINDQKKVELQMREKDKP